MKIPLRKAIPKPKKSFVRNNINSLLKNERKEEMTKRKEETFQKQKTKKMMNSSLTKNASPKKTMTNAGDLIASVEAFAAYLKEFSPDTEKDDRLTKISKSFTIDQDARLASLNREHSLQQELQQLRVLFEDERKRTEKLRSEIIFQEKKWENEKERHCFDYDKKIKDLHEEVFVLQKKLEIQNEEKRTLGDIKGKSVHEMSKEDIDRLCQQLEQQESLLTGYQQENERLYNEIKKRDIDKKKFEGKMFKENQKLASEVGNLKEQMELQSNMDSLKGPASLGAARITQLENQVKFYQKRESENKEEIVNLENEISSVKKMLSLYEKEKNKNRTELGVSNHIETLKANHELELNKLQKKLKWYAENQELLDKDLLELKNNREEIKELRSLINRLDEQAKKLKKEKLESSNARNTESNKITDLQRQVKEMEEIIRRRHPNSIPAMIYAASSVPGEDRVYSSSDSGEKSRPTNIYLEKRVKSLENELETKDLDNGKKARAIEKRYNSMSMRYEEHIKQLEIKIADLTVKCKSEKSVEILELELSKVKDDYSAILLSIKAELKDKEDQLSILKLQLHEKNIQRSEKSNKSSLQKEIAKVKSDLKKKNEEIYRLNNTVVALQQEREHFLKKSIPSKEGIYNTDRNISRSYLTDRTTSPLAVDSGLHEKCILLEKENKRLKNTIEEKRLEFEEKRLKCEALEVKTINQNRILRETIEDETNKVVEKYKQIIEKMKMDFVIEHSNSKVAELSGKLQSYEYMMDQLKETVGEARLERDKLATAKVTEESLRSEIRQLQDELHEARTHLKPEMHHYKNLEAKIYSMETRYTAREKELQTLVERTKYKASIDIDFVEDKWRDILRNKDLEIQAFREELDSIIEVLEELQRQGVILPNREINLNL